MNGCSNATRLSSLNCNELLGTSESISSNSTKWFRVKANDLGDLTLTLIKASSFKARVYAFESCSDSSGDYVCRTSSSGTEPDCTIKNAEGYYRIAVYNNTSSSGSFQLNAELDCYNCTPCYRNYCSGGNVWCEDSCGVESKLKERCSYGCSNGKCNSAPSCTNECSQGQVRCNGSFLQSCGNFDSDSCLEWNSGQYCQYGCSNSSCNLPPLSVSITSIPDSIENGYLGFVQWQTTGSIKETGVQVSYKSDKSDALKISTPLNNSNTYTAVLSPRDYLLPFMYVRTYAVANSGETKYSDWKTIALNSMCYDSQSQNTIEFQVEKVSLLELGWDFAKLLTIGNCIDNGIFTWGCAFDAVTLVPVASLAKLEKLSKGSKVLKEIGSIAKLSSSVKKIKLTIKGTKYSIEGTKLARAAELGVMEVDFAKGEIKTSYKALSEWFLKNGDIAINNLKKSGASNQMLENIIVKGGNLDRTIKAAESVKGTAWLEEGTYTKGWLHIFRGHVKPGDFRNAGIADEEVQDYIIKTVKEPSKGILASRGSKNWWCFFSFSKTVSTGVPFVKVIIDDKGYIRNAYPTRSYTCS